MFTSPVEEAGYEDANAKVKNGKKVFELSKNPVVQEDKTRTIVDE